MQIDVFGIPNCNTVKKALNWLESNGILYTFHDFKKQGVNPSLLEVWISNLGWEKTINRAGMTYRKLPEEEKAKIIDRESAIHAAMEKSSMIKRPILMRDGIFLAAGFSEKEYESLFL